MNKKILLPVMAMVFVVSQPQVGFADEHMSEVAPAWEISGNISVVSDYIFRGVSQSDETMAVQAGIDIAHETGLYAGLWSSQVDFNDGDEANIEVDLYAGYAWEWHDLQLDISGIYYAYPGADSSLDYDYVEAALAVGYDFGDLSTTASFYYSPDFFGAADDAYYSHLNLSYPIADAWTVSAATGYQSVDDGTDYQDWQFGVAYAWQNVEFFANYHDTDLARADCADGCDARVVVGATISFE